MQNRPGVFIVLEGSDGSGKGTQFRLLSERLQAAGYNVLALDFPRYSEPSSHFVRKYLAGDYGPTDSVNPYTASIFYALDRYEAAFDIKKALSRGDVVLSNRYVGSNMAHQGSKFSSEAEQRGFFMWEDSLEFQLLGIPRPDLNLFLHLPAEVSQQLIVSRSKKEGRQLDEHEKNLSHLQKSVEAYELLCKLFPKDFVMLECAAEGLIMPIGQISDLIWRLIQPMLAGLPRQRATARVVNLASTSKAPPKVDKPTTPPDTSENLLKGVNFVTKRTLLGVEGLHLKPVLGVSGRQKTTVSEDSVILKNCSVDYQQFKKVVENFLAKYRKALENTELSKKGRQDALAVSAASLQPLFYMADYYVSGEPVAVSAAEARLSSSLGPAKQGTAEKILEKINPPGSSMLSGVEVLECTPRNELDLLPGLLYTAADLSQEQLVESLENVPYEQKSRWLVELVASNYQDFLSAGARLVKYSLEVTASGLAVEKLLEAADWKDVAFQPASPHSGYPVPEVVEEVGLGELYSECFDASLVLFSQLQSQNLHRAAQYACLRGHYVRFRGQIGLDQLFGLLRADASQRLSHKSPGAVLPQILSACSQVHPLLVEQITLAALELSSTGRPTATEPAMKNSPQKRRRRSKKN